MNYEELYSLIIEDKLEWEYLISEIIREENINPLDIDISLLSDKFLQITNYLVKVDFYKAGKFIFIASILLRLKSQYLLSYLLGKRNEQTKTYNYVKSKPFPIILPAKFNVIRKRALTLNELIQYIKRAVSLKKENEEISFEIKLNEIKLSQKIDAFSKLLKSLFSSSPQVNFFNITKGKSWNEIVDYFISATFLFSDRKIDLYQENPMDDIVILNKSL
ncbi:MAG: segregation/condensation protein A [Candidatus Rehaiarchaeum fermentans]|nr:segregation/condensation protein A [Candidatus Rehaiarchaeum fermentans]